MNGRLVSSVAGLTLVAATVGCFFGIAGASPSHRAVAHPVASHKAKPKAYHLTLAVLVSGPGTPKFTANGRSSALIDLPANATVDVTLRSFDDGPAAPPSVYSRVTGTVGGVMTLNGRKVRSVPVATIAHTFTLPGIGLNIPIPAVKGKAKFVTEAFQFKTGKAGKYAWQCYAPCGTGSAGWGGPMVTAGQMMGEVQVGK